jgi:hypothetical protein
MPSTLINAYIPWLESDETLYSHCATLHKSDGYRSAARTADSIFGGAHATRQHEVPRKIDFWANGGSPLTAAQIINLLRRHTVAGYYLPFQEIERQFRAVDSLYSGSQAFSRKTLAMSSRSLVIAHPLKSCPLSLLSG